MFLQHCGFLLVHSERVVDGDGNFCAVKSCPEKGVPQFLALLFAVRQSRQAAVVPSLTGHHSSYDAL